MTNPLQDCQKCSRLRDYRASLKLEYPDYHCLPVPGFGDDSPRLLVVGLAPGLHGANAIGRPFTGDASGELLFRTLHRFGYSSLGSSFNAADGLQLDGCRITNAVKCVPPQNKPQQDEIVQCREYLRVELANLKPGAVVLALGTIAHRSILQALDLPLVRMRFAHLAEYALPGSLNLIDSYHCSRYNINTGRLNQSMFDQVFARVRQVLS